MYNLGDHFKNQNVSSLLANDNCVFKGSKYRITVLSERLIRLEYNNDGHFNDYETLVVKNRQFPEPQFSKSENESNLVIQTSYFTLTYLKNSSFSSNTLKAKLRDGKKEWYYGQKEVRNAGSMTYSLDNTLNLPKLDKGLFSFDGVATIDDSNSMRFDENSNLLNACSDKKNIDLYLFIYDKDFGMCLYDYFILTGFPPLIPRYALGNWWSRDYPYSEESAIELVDKFKRQNIPLSILLLDKEWSKYDEKYSIDTSFTFNNELFPHPEDFIKNIHERGLKLGVKINPQKGFFPGEKYYEMAKKYLTSQKNGVLSFNPLSMKDLDVYMKIFLNPLDSMGIDFYWNDYQDSQRNYFLNYYMYKNNLRLNKRSLLLSRNSMHSSHLFNIIYSGQNLIDWKVLGFLPYYNLSNANIGVSFQSHDIGGSVGGIEDNDFYLRSLQFGVFSPILRFNTEKGNYFKREPWKWDVVTESIANYYLRLRHRLIPYLYTEAYNYSKNGTPIIRPFYYNNIIFYDDENYVNQYYFGSEIMISPIIRPLDEVINRTIQKFYIPSGVWYDFKTGKKFLGNHKYISFYEIDDYPIFVKKGSIIPLAGEKSLMGYDNPKDLEIHIFPGESNTYHLYEDDGISFNYQNGHYAITEFDYNYRASNYTLIIRPIDGDLSVIPNKRSYKIVFRNTKMADKLVVYENGQPLDKIQSEVTDTDFVVYINDIDTKSQIVVNCYGQDIEIDSLKLIKDDIDDIISDLRISTVLKDPIAKIMFSEEMSLGKKRIAIRKLKRQGLDARSVKIFLRLLEYMEM